MGQVKIGRVGLAHWRSLLIVDPEDRDSAEMENIVEVDSILATIAVDLLQW